MAACFSCPVLRVVTVYCTSFSRRTVLRSAILLAVVVCFRVAVFLADSTSTRGMTIRGTTQYPATTTSPQDDSTFPASYRKYRAVPIPHTLPDSQLDAESLLFNRVEALLQTVEPWPACERVTIVGGRCWHCLLSRDGWWTYPQLDGEKPLCLDMLPQNCSVLSFGINDDFSFDEAMEDLGCVVNAFDPTMGRSSFRHSKGIQFYGVGLGPKDDLYRLTPLASLETVVKQLKLEKGIIDYVKLDIESSEWGVLKQQLDSGGDLLRVRQLTVEFHLLQWEPMLDEGQHGMPGRPVRHLSEALVKRFEAVLTALKTAGFQLVYTKLHSECQQYGDGCLRYFWGTLYVNTRLKTS